MLASDGLSRTRQTSATVITCTLNVIRWNDGERGIVLHSRVYVVGVSPLLPGASFRGCAHRLPPTACKSGTVCPAVTGSDA